MLTWWLSRATDCGSCGKDADAGRLSDAEEAATKLCFAVSAALSLPGSLAPDSFKAEVHAAGTWCDKAEVPGAVSWRDDARSGCDDVRSSSSAAGCGLARFHPLAGAV